MKILLTDVRGKKVVFELEVPPEQARYLVRRDQTVEFRGVRYGFMSTGKLSTRYCPILPPVQLTGEMVTLEAVN
jgi:hypothetical protein